MIQFKDKDGIIGTIEYVDGKLIASNSLRSIVDLWQHRGNDASDFESAYDGWSNGYVSGQRVLNGPSNVFSESVVAAARDDKRDGAMIALVPRAEDAERLALEDFEPPDELHVTLFYLGDAVNITSAQIDQLVAQLHQDVQTSGRQVPIFTQAFGVAHWNPESDYPAWVLNVGDAARDDPAGLTALRDSVERSVNGVGIDYPPQHSPWQPHICIAYSKDDLYGELASRLGKLTFDTLRVAWGEYDINIPLTAGDVVVADAAGVEALHLPTKHNQKSHGNRAGRQNNEPGKTSKHARTVDVTTGDDADTKLQTRIDNALVGNQVFTDGLTFSDIPQLGEKYESTRKEDDPTTKRMLSSFGMYKGMTYHAVNKDLREGNELDDFTGRVVGYMDLGMDLSEVESDIIVYRGITAPDVTFGDSWREDEDHTGMEWQDLAYMSTSTNPNVARGFSSELFSSGVAMRMIVPKGIKAVAMRDPSWSSKEDEVLLNRGQRIRVLRDYVDNGIRTFDVEVIQ